MESRVSSASAVRAHVDLAEASVTSYGWKALAGSVTGFSMDGFDMLILGFMSPCYLFRFGSHKHSGRLAGYLDDARCGCRWTHFWNHERPPWPNPSPDVDHFDLRRFHRSLCFSARLLGFG